MDKKLKAWIFLMRKFKFPLRWWIFFLFTSPEYAPIEKSVDTKKENNFFYRISKSDTVIVNGTVQAGNMNIGGTEIFLL